MLNVQGYLFIYLFYLFIYILFIIYLFIYLSINFVTKRSNKLEMDL